MGIPRLGRDLAPPYPVARVAPVPRHVRAQHHRGVAAQVEIESKLEIGLSYFSFKLLVPGSFNLGLIGATCTALLRGTADTSPPKRASPSFPFSALSNTWSRCVPDMRLSLSLSRMPCPLSLVHCPLFLLVTPLYYPTESLGSVRLK